MDTTCTIGFVDLRSHFRSISVMPTSEPLHVAENRSEGRFNFYIVIPSASHSSDAVIALLVGCTNIHLREQGLRIHYYRRRSSTTGGTPSGSTSKTSPRHSWPLPSLCHRRATQVLEMGQEEKAWGPQERLLRLIDHGVTGTGVIGAYHARKVVPLMAHRLHMYQMTSKSSWMGF